MLIQGCRYLVLLSLLFLACLAPYSASANGKHLVVGVALGEPFAYERNGQLYGLAVDIWKDLADEMKLDYELRPLGEHVDEAIATLAAGKIDVLIGPIVPTTERMKLVDFMQPYYLNQIGLVVPVQKVAFFHAFLSIFNGNILLALMLLFFFFFLYLHVFWYYELRTSSKRDRHYWHGILDAFWQHTLDIDLGKIPTHVHTRIFRFFWLAIVTLFFSSLTATITSALTVALSSSYVGYQKMNELRDKPVAVVINTAPYDLAKELRFSDLIPVDSRDKAIALVLKGKASAYMDYYAISDYYIGQHNLSTRLSSSNLVAEQSTFAFALPFQSPLRAPLNIKLRVRQQSGAIQLLCNRYFTNESRFSLNGPL